MGEAVFVRHSAYERLPVEEMRRRAVAFYETIRRRRTVREYSDEAVPRDVIEQCLLAAGTAPNGANRQPWHFVVVTDAGVKRRIREAAEGEERDFYEHRAPPEWLAALAPLGTGPEKPFVEEAPVLIAIFAQSYEVMPDGGKAKNYYVTESVGIATGILITALHESGLVTLTHTPSPMGFLNDILERPSNERPFLLLVVGYPAEDATVPDIGKKRLDEIATFDDGWAT
jgi:iodotyrosine deiodinase